MDGVAGATSTLFDYEVYWVREDLLSSKMKEYDGTEHEINLVSR